MSRADAAGAAEARLEARIEALEVKASYADDVLDALNQIVARQQAQIDRLNRELGQLREQQDQGGGTPRSLRDELPPHY